MARIEFPDAKAALDRTYTWDTAADLTSGVGLLHYNSINLTDNPNYLPITNADNVHVNIKEGAQDPNISIEASLQYDGLINEIIAAVFGTVSAPAEQTGGQSDYLHNIDLASSNLTIYQTLAYKIESDQVIEVPSIKWNDLTIRGESNNFAMCTVTGLSGSVLYSGANGVTPENTATDIGTLSLPSDPPEFALAGGSGLYCRLNAASGDALDSGDDQQILSFELRVTRPLDATHPFRGANTKYPTEPIQLQAYDATLTLVYDHIDDADHDPRKDRDDQTEKKCEIALVGTQIGSGDNRQYLFQFPSMKAIDAPGYGPQRDQRLAPSVTYRLFKRSSAPTGMTGVTVPRIALTNTRSVTLL